MSLSPQFLDELRARTSLSTLIGRTTKLTRAGREFKACCPFHQEKTPSFWVNDEKGFYHCFGCSAHGDAIRWLTESQGLGFMDAVRELAGNAGMALPAPDPQQQEKAERAAGLHDVVARAERWFAEQLAGVAGGDARAYLARRGIEPDLGRDFGLGFAPDARAKLKAALADCGEEALVAAGLLIEVEGKERYDRFRGRLMIPIRDPRGRTIAFGGRIIGDGEPKYLNSPETPLFDKGHTLYNLDRAAPAARKAGRLLVVEGYLDVIGLARAGIAEAVAPLGTALTEQQMALLWRVNDAPTLCFDGDTAGARAATRAAARALPVLPLGRTLRFAALPAGKDPDDLAREGAATFEAAIARTESLVSLLYRAERAAVDAASPDDRAGLRGRLDALAASATDRLVADEYRRSFNGLFFEEFGWKRRDREAVRDLSLRTGPSAPPALARSFIRSALYGLTRFPQVAAGRLEAVAGLRIDHDDFRRWRDVLVDIGVSRPTLGDDGIAAILAAERLTAIAAFDLRFDLRFPFGDSRVPPGVAVERLTGLIELLNEESDLDEEMARLNARAIADSGLDRYESIEAARQQVRERKLRLRHRSFELGLVDAMAAGDGAPPTAMSGRN